MSKTFRPFLFVFAAFVLILQLFNNSSAQDVEVSIRIDAKSPRVVSIYGLSLKSNGNTNLSFLLDYGNISGLGKRISNVHVFDANNKLVNIRRMIAGEYVADRAFQRWSYDVDLTPLKQPSAPAHISWLGESGGVLMLGDLLPQFDRKTSLEIGFDIPRDWELTTIEKIATPDMLQVADSEKAVFFLYSRGQQRQLSLGRSVELTLSGDWRFSDNDAKEIATSIFGEFKSLFGAIPSGDKVIGIRKFPISVSDQSWEADTRGGTITVIATDAPFKSQSLQQLHEQLRHEIFHFWIPNGVNLSGNYDWFYEGFALYQSLKTGVALNRIRFDDYLDTLSRAYDVDRGLPTKLSLIDVSRNRWSGDNNTKVYARGMLVAFLCDLALLERSKGKRSVDDLLRKLYEEHRPPATQADANATVLSLLRSYSELSPTIDRNILGSERIDWDDLLKGVGLEAQSSGPTTRLVVTAKPSGQQKNLLDKLGYNNWRKLSSK